MEFEKINLEINKVWTEMKGVLDKQELEIKKFGEGTGETKGLIEALEKRLDELEIKAKRPGIGEQAKSEEIELNKKAFGIWLRRGESGLNIEQKKLLLEKKVMTTNDDTTGGVFCLPERDTAEILKNIIEYDMLRTVAKVRQTSAKSVILRTKTGNITGGQWVGEIAARSDLGEMNYSSLEVPVHEISGYVDVSLQDLEDPDFSIEQELNSEFAEQFGVTEGLAFISGNGVNKPEGILTTNASRELSASANGHGTDLQPDGLISICYDIKSAYVPNAVWLMNRSTLKAVRKLKDGSGNYLWIPNFNVQQQPTILERPYVECPNMPNVGANTYPIVFGDIKKLYTIIDRVMIQVIRDPYTQASTGTVRFYARKRVGGQIIQKEAARKLKIAVSV